MNTYDAEIMNILYREPFVNQRVLAESAGCSVGAVNKSLKQLTRDGYLDGSMQLTAKARQEIKDRAEREKNAAKEAAQKKAEERRKLEAKSVSFEKKIADAQAQMQKSETLTEEQRKEACATIVTAHTIMKRYNSERPLVSESVFEKKYKQSIMGSNSFKELMTYPPEKLAKLATEKNGVGLHGAMLEIARKNEKQKQANANNGRSSHTLGKTEPQPGMGMGGKKTK